MSQLRSRRTISLLFCYLTVFSPGLLSILVIWCYIVQMWCYLKWWNNFPLNVYKCDAIISKHKMLFQNFKIPGCYLKFLGRTLIWFGCFVVLYIHVHWYFYWECEYMFIIPSPTKLRRDIVTLPSVLPSVRPSVLP
jgi:hypothetical protein